MACGTVNGGMSPGSTNIRPGLVLGGKVSPLSLVQVHFAPVLGRDCRQGEELKGEATQSH